MSLSTHLLPLGRPYGIDAVLCHPRYFSVDIDAVVGGGIFGLDSQYSWDMVVEEAVQEAMGVLWP